MMQSDRESRYAQEIYTVQGLWTEAPALYVATLGRFRSRGAFRWEQVAADYSVHAILGGEGVMCEDGVETAVGRGQVFVFQPGRHYVYFDQPGRPWRYTWFRVVGNQVGAAFAALGGEGAPMRFDFRDHDPFWHWLGEVEQAFQCGSASGAMPIRAAWQAVEWFELARSGPRPDQPLADRARAMIDASPQLVPTVDALAEYFGVDRSTLFRHFKARFGIALKTYIDEVRFKRVCALLRRSARPVGEIGALAGFRDPLYFSRAFRRRMGMPPGEWRAQKKDPTDARDVKN